ncbi:MAG TPA: translation initiation factor IF-2 N-terminal domain-containing protein, partial [Gemmatimonadales bacterium]
MATRIHDLAAEFGISSEQVMSMLKEVDIFVRSHLTPLKDEQVAMMRARWEREKRRQKEPAPTAGKRRRTVKAPEPAPVVEEARPKRRRRTAAEVAAAEAEAQVEADRVAAEQELRTRAALEASRVQEEEKAAISLEERAAALFRDIPSTEPAIEAAPAALAPPAAPVGAAPPLAPTAPPPLPTPVPGAPRQFIPTPVRPKPVASGMPGGAVPPRPVASAAPGAGALEERRRDKAGKKRKKGRKSSVDQEAVAQNISRTLASIKGPVARRGARPRDEGPSFRDIQEERRAAEKEREKTLVRVTEFITVSELANVLKVPPTQIVTFAFKELGQMVTINQRLDFDLIELIASAFGFQAV